MAVDPFRSLLGVFALVAVGFAFSASRRSIRWRIVIGGLALQFSLALLFFRVPVTVEAFEAVARVVATAIGAADAGARFVFGSLADPAGPVGFVFAFRVVPVIMPSTRIIPAPAMQYLIFEIPVNDRRTVTFGATYRLDGGPIDVWKLNELGGRHQTHLLCPTTFEYLGTWDDRFGQDRDAMKTGWSGIHGVAMEDLAISMSQGPIADRSREVLVAADKAVVRARRQLLESARRIAAGDDPIGVDADVSRLIAIDENTPRDARWQALVPGHRAAAHTMPPEEA